MDMIEYYSILANVYDKNQQKIEGWLVLTLFKM